MQTTTYFTSSEVAHLADVTPSTVNRWATSGTLPASKVPGGRGVHLYAREAVYAHLDITEAEALAKLEQVAA